MPVALFGHLILAHPYGHGHDSHANAPYRFEYDDVKNLDTNDIKSQRETSNGPGNVKGSYELVDPYGSTKMVEYTADHEHGFNAIVKKIAAVAAEVDSYYGHESRGSMWGGKGCGALASSCQFLSTIGLGVSCFNGIDQWLKYLIADFLNKIQLFLLLLNKQSCNGCSSS